MNLGTMNNTGTGVRILQADVEEAITRQQFHHFEGTTTTVCCLTLRNGFSVIGSSSCVAPENFNADDGRTYARAAAMDKVCEMESYLLKQRLFTFGK